MEFKKFLQMISEESTETKDQHAEKAGKKVAKDIEYDEGHDSKDDDKAEKAGKKVTKDIEYDDKKKKSLKDWFEHIEADILNEDQFQLPVVGPDGRTVAGQTGFLEVNTQGQDGVAINNLLRTLGGRHMKIILPPNRIQQTQQQQALQAAQRAAKQGGGRQVQEELDENYKTEKMKEQAPLKSNDPFDADTNALKAITKNAGVDSKPLAFDSSVDDKLSIGSQPKVTAEPAAPIPPATPAATPAATAGGMSDEERYGKVGAEIRRLGGDEAYKNRPKDYQGNIDYLNKLRTQKAGDTAAPAAPAAPATPDAADALEPVNVTGKRTQAQDQDKPGDAELGRLLNLAGANTYDELNNYLKTGSTQAPAQPAASKDDTLDQLQKDVDTVDQEPVDAAGDVAQPSEPAAEPAKADVKTSYQIRDPNTGRTRPVSKEKYDSMVKRNQIDTNVPLDYAFKVRNPSGEIETVTYKDNPERWSQIASQNAEPVGNLNAKLGADLAPQEKEKGQGKSLFRKLFNIGKDDQGYYMGKKRGRDNAPEPESIAEARKILEKWAGDAKVKPTGQYKDKTEAELKSMLAKLKKSGPHDKDSPAAKKMRQINFALRAKGGWKSGEGAAMKEEALNEKAKNPYAIGMAQAMKSTGDKPPLKKSTIVKAHDIAKSVKKKTDEAEIPSSGPDYGAGLGAGRSDKVLEAKPDFLDLDKDGNKKESMKKAAADKKKKQVKESMNFKKLKAAYQEGYAHGLRELAARVKHYEDMEEAKQYFEGYKLGLEECYGLSPNRGLVGEESGHDIVDNMASFGAEEGSLAEQDMAQERPQAGQVTTKPAQPQPSIATAMQQKQTMQPAPQMNVGGVPANKPDGSSNMSNVMQSRANLSQMGQQAAMQTNEADIEESPFSWAAKNTPKGEKFTVGGKEFIKNDAFAFEDLDRQLNALLEDNTEVVTEGLSVSMSTGQNGSPDSVSVTATDDDSAKLLDFIKQVGLGGLGGDKAEVVGSVEPAVAVVSDYGAPKFSGHDGMKDLMSKMMDIDDGHDHEHDHPHACNECGMMEEKCECEKEKVEESVQSKKKLDENVLAMLPGLLRAGAGLTGAALQRAGAWAAAHPVQAAMLASHLASMMQNRSNDDEELDETETLDQREEMVAENDGEDNVEADAQGAEIDAALALGSQNEKNVTEQKAEDLDMGDDYKPEFGTDMKNMLGKLDNISNTSSYEVDGKSASKADYDKAMSNFKMPDMPDLPDNTPADVKNMLAGAFKGLGQQMKGVTGKIGSMAGGMAGQMGAGNAEPYYTLSKADMDAVLPDVAVTGKRVGGEKLPGDDELGRLLNLAGASTYDELASFLKNRKGNPVPPGDDQLEPVQVTGKRVPVPGSEDELQPVQVTSKKVPVPGDDNASDSDIDVKNMQAQLDAMMKDIMPRMNDRAQDQLDFDQEQSNLTRAAAGDWFRNKIGSGASLDNPRTQDKLNRLRDMKEETTDKMDQDAEKAGKKVAKDIEHDEGHKGKDDDKAEKAGKKVTKDIEYDDKKDREHNKLDEWANDAGKKGTDASFERDIEFMTQTISGGLNKPKSTGQTTIPVIAGQEAREGDEDVTAWKKLAGLAK